MHTRHHNWTALILFYKHVKFNLLFWESYIFYHFLIHVAMINLKILLTISIRSDGITIHKNSNRNPHFYLIRKMHLRKQFSPLCYAVITQHLIHFMCFSIAGRYWRKGIGIVTSHLTQILTSLNEIIVR